MLQLQQNWTHYTPLPRHMAVSCRIMEIETDEEEIQPAGPPSATTPASHTRSNQPTTTINDNKTPTRVPLWQGYRSAQGGNSKLHSRRRNTSTVPTNRNGLQSKRKPTLLESNSPSASGRLPSLTGSNNGTGLKGLSPLDWSIAWVWLQLRIQITQCIVRQSGYSFYVHRVSSRTPG